MPGWFISLPASFESVARFRLPSWAVSEDPHPLAQQDLLLPAFPPVHQFTANANSGGTRETGFRSWVTAVMVVRVTGAKHLYVVMRQLHVLPCNVKFNRSAWTRRMRNERKPVAARGL